MSLPVWLPGPMFLLGGLCPGSLPLGRSLSGGSLCSEGLCPVGSPSRGLCPEGSLSGGSPSRGGGFCPGGNPFRGVLCPGVSVGRPPDRDSPTMVDKQAVCILLECCLVLKCIEAYEEPGTSVKWSFLIAIKFLVISPLDRAEFISVTVLSVSSRSQGESWEIVKNPLWICIFRVNMHYCRANTHYRKCKYTSLLIMHILNGFLTISQLSPWDWEFTLRTESEVIFALAIRWHLWFTIENYKHWKVQGSFHSILFYSIVY